MQNGYVYIDFHLFSVSSGQILKYDKPHDDSIPEVPFHAFLLEQMVKFGDQIACVSYFSLVLLQKAACSITNFLTG